MLMKVFLAQEQLRPPVSQFLGNDVEQWSKNALIVCPFYLNLFCFYLLSTSFYRVL